MNKTTCENEEFMAGGEIKHPSLLQKKRLLLFFAFPENMGKW